MFKLKINVVFILSLSILSGSSVDIANQNFGNPVKDHVANNIHEQPQSVNKALNNGGFYEGKVDSQFGQSNEELGNPVDGKGALPQVQMIGQGISSNVAPGHQVMDSVENIQPQDKKQPDTLKNFPHDSQVASQNKLNFPKNIQNIPQDNQNSPNNGPNVPQNNQNFLNTGRNIPQNNQNFQNNGPNIPQNNQKFQNNGLNIPQNNQNFQNNGPNIPQNNQNFQNNGLNIPQNNQNFQNNGLNIPQNNQNFQNNGRNIPQNNQNFQNNGPNIPQNNQNFLNNQPNIPQKAPNFPQHNVNEPLDGNGGARRPFIKTIVHRNPPNNQGSYTGFIAESGECKADVETVCGSINPRNNFDVLYCLTNNVDNYQVSDDCQQYIWSFKLNTTTDGRFQMIARTICQQDLINLSECAKYSNADGKLIPCLLDNKETITAVSCNSFIRKIQTIMFSDYRLVCDFVSDCKEEIKNANCGKMADLKPDTKAVHSQGEVINCLEREYGDSNMMSPECRKQIALLAELSADDYHLDRHLYFKCKSDRQSLCANVVSGQGRVYKCLFDHKFDQQMSAECSEALTSRQKVIAGDYKASYGLTHHCKDDIDKNMCSNGKSDGDVISLAKIMLCLENQSLNGIPISPSCDDELVEYRRMIMQDYELSPEIVHECSAEVRDKCENGLEKEGKTLHCLFALAQEENGINADCQNALMDLIKETEVAQDYRVDGVLTRACHSVIHAKCGDLQDGDPMILTCLMDNMHSKEMEKKCKDRLIELQYFISRDFYIDPVFRDACKDDAASLCSAPSIQGAMRPGDEGEDTTPHDDNDLGPMPFSMVMSCLYRHIHADLDDPNIEGELTPECEDEVHRIIKQRALDINLNPDIEKNCRLELGQFCSEQTIEKGTELVCLQDNYENMDPGPCRAEISKLTQMESRNIGDFDAMLIKECEPMLDKYCSDTLDSEDDGRVMECLIDHKEEMESAGCAAGVTHFQLITLKDYKFDYKFLKACKRDVGQYCADKKMGTKADVVSCLSVIIRNDVLGGSQESSISSECKEQLTVEKLQTHKSIELNPELKAHCQRDQKKLCVHIKTGKAQVIECLREKKRDLSPLCYKALFNFEEEEFKNPNLDYKLMRACKSDVKEHCKQDLENGDAQLVLECLLRKKSSLIPSCRMVVTEREKEMFSNVDLNNDLKESCQADIDAWCQEARQEANDAQYDGRDPEGIVYQCLKKVFVSKSPKESLSASCYNHVEFVIAEQEKNYVLDPQLTLRCFSSIKQLCSPTEGRNVVDCLKNQYFQNKLSDNPNCMMEVARLLVEGQSDIMADPVLYEACSTDLTKHCMRVPEGHGRLIACLTAVEVSFLTSECFEELQKRREMWKLAMKNNVNGLIDLSDMVVNSGHSSYIVSVLTLLIICIMFAGAVCGRLSRRVAIDRKSR